MPAVTRVVAAVWCSWRNTFPSRLTTRPASWNGPIGPYVGPGPRAILGPNSSRGAPDHPRTGPAPRTVGSSGRRLSTGRPGSGRRNGGRLSMTTEQTAASINPWQVAQQQFDLAAG